MPELPTPITMHAEVSGRILRCGCGLDAPCGPGAECPTPQVIELGVLASTDAAPDGRPRGLVRLFRHRSEE